MMVAAFVPEVWAARFTSKLEDALVYGSRTNRNYEGEIAMYGDTVKIPTSTTTVTVKDYMENTDIDDPELAKGTTQDLQIDQQKYFHFYVDDITELQTRPALMDDTMREAAQTVAETVDDHLNDRFASAYDAKRAVDVASAADAAPDKFLESMIVLKRMMTDANIPMGMRWIIVPPVFIEKIERHFIAQGGSAAGVFAPATADMTVRNGYAGNLVGFDLLGTVQGRIPHAGDGANKKLRCVAGQGMEALTMAQQITEIEAYRPERRFGDAVKGLYVYGSKVVHADRIFFNVIDDPLSS